MYEVGQVFKEFCVGISTITFAMESTGLVIRVLIPNPDMLEILDFQGDSRIDFGRKKNFMIIRYSTQHKNILNVYSPNVYPNTRVLLPGNGYGYNVTLLLLDSCTGTIVDIQNSSIDENISARLCADLLDIMDTGLYSEQAYKVDVLRYRNLNSDEDIYRDLQYGSQL